MARRFPSLCAALALLASVPSQSAEYFVSKTGNDANDGASKAKSFLSIQKGVDALKPGDVLTIGPGEYYESVAREDLGGPDADTVIRAEIPGTVVLRNDVPAPEFKNVDGYRFVYAASFDREPNAVLDHNNWHTFFPKANVSELEFDPGFFHYDADAKRLYLSNPDMCPPDQCRYTVVVEKEKQGLDLKRPRRVVVEGLAATGFDWGVLMISPVSCVVRNCVFFMNTGGVMMQGPKGVNEKDGGSHNLVENCVCYGNTFGGVVRFSANNDVVRDCLTFKNVQEGKEHFGVMHYGFMPGPLIMKNNISFGQNYDYSVKPGGQHEKLENSVGLGFIRIHTTKMSHDLFGDGNEYGRGSKQPPPDTILLPRERNLDEDFEFADHLNLDFRLQADSRFREAAPDGSDVGPHPYETNVFYVSPDGDDQADGLSMRTPWRTLERAFKNLRPGDTLYLTEGEYEAAPLNETGDAEKPVRIRGRARGTVVVKGELNVTGGAEITLERLNFADGVVLSDCRGVTVRNCVFFGGKDGLIADKVKSLTITHCEFVRTPTRLTGCQAVTLTGNIFANDGEPALTLDAIEAIRHSDHNDYQDAERCWDVAGAVWPLAKLRPKHDLHSQTLAPEFIIEKGAPLLKNAAVFRGLGPLDTALGVYHEYDPTPEALRIVGPFLHSTSDSTANIEWWSSRPATYELAWGETPKMTNVVRQVSGPERFNTFSLVDLKPGQTYHFAIRSATRVADKGAAHFPTVKLEDAALSFKTAAQPAAPKVYHVAPDGDDANDGLTRETAFRTINRAAAKVGPGDTVMIASGDYNETLRVRAAGTKDRPITFRRAPGAEAVIRGEGLAKTAEVIDKPDNRFDGLYFRGQSFWRQGFVVRRSPRVWITRCFETMIEASESPDMVIRNCVLRGGWKAVGLSRCPGSIVENNVFIGTILRQITCDSPAVVRGNVFWECLRGKCHQTLLQLSDEVTETDNCFYLRWPEDEKLAVNNLPLPLYRLQTGSEAMFANPMMPAAPGWSQGWPKGGGEDFNGYFTTNPELVLRGIGLRPEAFADFKLKPVDASFLKRFGLPSDPNMEAGKWPYDRAWAEKFTQAEAAAEALARAGKDADALAAFDKMLETLPMSNRMKSDVLEKASRCAERLKDYDRATKLAKEIPFPVVSMRRQMEILLNQRKYAELIETFNQKKLGGRSFALSYVYPELEDLMADLYHMRSVAYAETGDLAAAEADLKEMNDKRMRLGYRAGEAIHDLTWLRLGDFYRDRLHDDARALEAYKHVLDRSTWAVWAKSYNRRPRKPVLLGLGDTLAKAAEAAAAILRKQGKTDEVKAIQAIVLKERGEALAALREDAEAIAEFKKAMAVPGISDEERKACETRISEIEFEAWRRKAGVEAFNPRRPKPLAPENVKTMAMAVENDSLLIRRDAVKRLAAQKTLSDEARKALVQACGDSDLEIRKTAVEKLATVKPMTDDVKNMMTQLSGDADEEIRRTVIQATLKPTLDRMTLLKNKREWRKLIDEFNDVDFAAWKDEKMAGEAFFLRGEARMNLKEAEKAQTDLEASVKLAPENAHAWHVLAENYQTNLKDLPKAKMAALRAHELAGVGGGWLNYSIALQAADILRELNEPAAALALLEKFDLEKVSKGYWRDRFEKSIESLKSAAAKPAGQADGKRP